MMKLVILTLTILLLAPTVQAARVHGNIYSPELKLLKNAIVEVNSTPRQLIVAADGTYSFELLPGSYVIEAFYSNAELLYAKEEIRITAESSYVVDLILFEIPGLEELELNESEFALIEKLLEKPRMRTKIILIAAIAAIAAISGMIAYRIYKQRKLKKRQKLKKKKQRKEKRIKEIFSPDETLNKVISLIKKEERITQKELRKRLNMSEAKASLLIADLEDRGLVRKIKRGRGNIIIYQGES